jgi:hypothetical protein
MAEVIAKLRRHPIVASAVGLLAVGMGSTANAGVGGVLTLGWFALVAFFVLDWSGGRTTPSNRAIIAAPTSQFLRPSRATRNNDVEIDVPVARVPIPPKLRFDVLTRDNYTCQYCGAKGPQAGGAATLEIDHRVPVAHGGTNDPVNLVTSCAECNRGKGATRIDGAVDPGRTMREHQWETCQVTIRMEGDERRQAITVSATRYGAGKSYFVIKPQAFTFQISLPPGGFHKLASLEAYVLMLKDKDRWKFQNFVDQVEAKLRNDGWQQTSKREWRRVVR